MKNFVPPHNHTFARTGVCSPFTSSAQDGERPESMLPHAQEAERSHALGELAVFLFSTRRKK
jgi:hypothetical protein